MIKEYNYSQHLCCDCSTIEGESELSITVDHNNNPYIPLQGWSPHSAPLDWCCDARPCSGTALYEEWTSAEPPIQRLPSNISSHQLANLQDSCTPCLTSPLPSKCIYCFIFSAKCQLTKTLGHVLLLRQCLTG